MKRSGANVGACGADEAGARWKIVGCGRIAGNGGTCSPEDVGKLLLALLVPAADVAALVLLGDKPWWINERMSMGIYS